MPGRSRAHDATNRTATIGLGQTAPRCASHGGTAQRRTTTESAADNSKKVYHDCTERLEEERGSVRPRVARLSDGSDRLAWGAIGVRPSFLRNEANGGAPGPRRTMRGCGPEPMLGPRLGPQNEPNLVHGGDCETKPIFGRRSPQEPDPFRPVLGGTPEGGLPVFSISE
jgi:hypothetical protein